MRQREAQERRAIDRAAAPATQQQTQGPARSSACPARPSRERSRTRRSNSAGPPRGKSLSAGDLAVPGVRQDQAAERAESRPRSASSRAPCRASRRGSAARLRRGGSPSGLRSPRSSPAGTSSVLRPCRSPTIAWIGAVQQQHPHRHREHRAHRSVVAAAQQMPAPRGADEERGREEGGDHHVHQAVRERRIEDHRQPVDRHDAAVDDLVALRRLHPAVRGQDPGRRDERADRDHQRREEMQTRADACPGRTASRPRKPASRKNAVSTS